MKKILSFIFMLLVMLGLTTLTACEDLFGPEEQEQTNTDQTLVDEIANQFAFTTTEVSADFTLKTSAAGGVLITWTSNNAAIAINGQNATVTRPAFADGDVTVTLTATFSKGDATATKTFDVKVLKAEDTSAIETATVAEALALEVGEKVTVRGVVGAVHWGTYNNAPSAQGFYLIDTTGAVYVYGYQLAANVVKGDEIVIEAQRAEHNGAAQLTNPNLVGNKVSTGNDIPTDAARNDVTIANLAGDLNNTSYFGLYLIFENVTVKKITGDGYVSYTLMDTNGNEVNLYSGGDSSEFAVYDEYIGKTLKLSYMVNGKNSKGTKWRGHIVEILEVGGDFTPGQGGGNDGGEVPADTITVAEAIAASVGSNVAVKGVVAAIHWGSYNNAPSAQGCYIADTTGIIYVYGYAVAQNVAIGDEIVVEAQRAEHKGAYQLSNPSNYSKVSSGNNVPRDYAITDTTLADVATNMSGNYYGKAFIFTNVSISKYDGGSYVSYTVVDADGNAVNLYSGSDGSEFAVYDQYIGQSIDLCYVVNGQNSNGDKWRGHIIAVLSENGGTVTPDPDQPGTEEPGTDPDQPGTDSDVVTTIAGALTATAGTKVELTGTVSKIYQEYNAQYDNISAYIKDASGKEILAFRMTGKVAVGDVIKVTGEVTLYGETNQIAQGCTFEMITKHTCEYSEATCLTPATCVACGEAKDAILADHDYANGVCKVCNAVDPDYTGEVIEVENLALSFSDKANRTTFTSSQQVWEANGVKLTNDKASSTSNVADYANPARFYKSSKLTIECSNMTKIEFVCNNSSYASALKSSIAADSNYTVTVNGSTVTVTFNAPVNSFVIASLTGGQVRMNSLTVTHQK